MAKKTFPKTFTEEQLRAKLTADQYQVTQNAGTEPAYTGIYHDSKTEGTYCCVVCAEPLFTSDTKYESGSGWPSFYAPIDESKIESIKDRSHGMVRIESVCGSCGAHLGHVFPDGPKPTGQRYCMNSASLNLVAAEDADGNTDT